MATVWMLGANQVIDTDIATVTENQVVVLHGYDGGRYVVTAVQDTRSGKSYKLINLKTGEYDNAQLIRPLSQKFGIGFYFDSENPEFIDPFEMVVLRDKAEKNKKEAEKAREAEKQRIDKRSEEGKERLKKIVPAGCTSVVMAYLHKDDSDTQTDYFSYKTVRSVILGFSGNTRNNFSEMRKCAANFEETKHLSLKNDDYEHRENYTGGSGYYLGENKYSGWIIEKESYLDREKLIENLSYTAGAEDNIQLEGSHKLPSVPIADIQAKVFIVEYSEKSIAVFGETKAIKDILSDLKGAFNSRLKYQGQICPGWIFPKNRKNELENLINNGN